MNSMKDKILIFFKGMMMGLADLIPGVSGGTIALIVGIYDELIDSLSALFSNIHRFFRFVKEEPFMFLLTLYLGVFTSIFLFSNLVKFLLASYVLQTFAFFTGLVFASAILLFKRVKFSAKHLLIAAIGFIVGSLITGFSAALNHSLLTTFFSGFIAICAMILPGISGAFVLTMLGQYRYIINALTSFNMFVLLVFVVGILLGLFIMSRFLKWLLARYHNGTLYFLIGLMIGGARNLLSYASRGYVTFSIFAVIGFVFVLALEFFALKKPQKNQNKKVSGKIYF